MSFKYLIIIWASQKFFFNIGSLFKNISTMQPIIPMKLLTSGVINGESAACLSQVEATEKFPNCMLHFAIKRRFSFQPVGLSSSAAMKWCKASLNVEEGTLPKMVFATFLSIQVSWDTWNSFQCAHDKLKKWNCYMQL